MMEPETRRLPAASAIDDYKRTPVPKSAHSPVLAIIALWMGLIFSPFIGFAINGRVDGTNWTPAVMIASCCLAGLLFLHLRAALAFRGLSQEIRSQYRDGRLMLPLLGVGPAQEPLEFAVGNAAKPMVGLTQQGVWFGLAATAGSSWHLARKLVAIQMMTQSDNDDQLSSYFVGWNDVAEWHVCHDSDGPNYYRLIMRDGGYSRLKRPANPEQERRILDYVRTVGGRPVRLFCDIG